MNFKKTTVEMCEDRALRMRKGNFSFLIKIYILLHFKGGRINCQEIYVLS